MSNEFEWAGHGARYYEHARSTVDLFSPQLAWQILTELPNCDLNGAIEFYRWIEYEFPDRNILAYLGCNDRFYLLTEILGRVDLRNQWLFDRCREVETDPDGHIDLWARFHAKTSMISIGGAIQEIVRNPNITIAIFSATKPLAAEILGAIKNELEGNERLKEIYSDILYENPRGKDPNTGERPAKWSLARGITVRREQRPKEATIEAHGLIDGQPTGRHFALHIYDDIVTQDNLSPDLIKKTTERFELADNLGTSLGTRKWIVGTRYHFGDTYGTIIDRASAKPRIYAATGDGTMTGPLVLLTPERWAEILKQQSMKTIAAQMLLDPIAGNERTFRPHWLRQFDVLPRVMNVYILVDPSKGMGRRSDRTAIAVIGIDPAGNKYLIDGVCHRMRLTERFSFVERFKNYYESLSHAVKVGWERYGMQVDLEVVEDLLMAKDNNFPIEELNTPRQGLHSKPDRIERLEPDIRGGRFYVPAVVWHSDFGDKNGPFAGDCYWQVWTEEDAAKVKAKGEQPKHHVGQIVYRPVKGLTRAQRDYTDTQYRIVKSLKRRDENNDVYDLTRVFIDEMVLDPFAVHDDLIDAVSRIYDIDPLPPTPVDAKSTESLDSDDFGIEQTEGGYEDA